MMTRAALVTLIAIILSSCAHYTTPLKVGKNSVLIVRNDMMLGGLWPGAKIYLCKVTKKGLSNCKTNQNP
ncbi:MAG: hypothetical protein HN730_05330 [Bdellovibrionales bacterium]|jgi:hypothetical protein|nr:hypothetical protein [Bdellovibrionales bacterium]MBT7766557.1 hypothetical protein [Bdellovibrionales bacterium]